MTRKAVCRASGGGLGLGPARFTYQPRSCPSSATAARPCQETKMVSGESKPSKPSSPSTASRVLATGLPLRSIKRFDLLAPRMESAAPPPLLAQAVATQWRGRGRSGRECGEFRCCYRHGCRHSQRASPGGVDPWVHPTQAYPRKRTWNGHLAISRGARF